MSTRTKEEERALDEKIARIQRQNEEILRRRQEIEEDKRLAEEQNAIVNLKPSSANLSRERTPALKPSNRELTNNFPEDDDPEYHAPRILPRGGSRGRAIGERMRSRSDWKAGGGPPPDPRSFLYDVGRDEQDVRNIRGRSQDIRSNTGDIRSDTGDMRVLRDSQEYSRGRRRGGRTIDVYIPCGRGGVRKNMEEEWRAERMKIDEARIQRQRAADGKWRREWDSDKLQQEAAEESIHEYRKYNPRQEVRGLPFKYSVEGHGYTSPISPSRFKPIPRGRGRGRLDPTELKMQLEKFTIPSKLSPVGDSSPNNNVLDPTRSVECVGESVKISIPNKGSVQSSPKPQRTSHGTRGRFRSQTSCSSQSDEDMSVDRSNRGGRRQRSQKSGKTQDKNQAAPSGVKEICETLPLENKPPLPPFRAEQKPPAKVQEVVEVKGDESWEDVTTSGTESMGEEMSSVNSSPLRRTMIISGKKNEAIPTSLVQSLEVFQNQPLDEEVKNSYEEYIRKIEMDEDKNKAEGKVIDAPELMESADASSFDARHGLGENVEYPVLLQDFKTSTYEGKDSFEDKVVEFPLVLQDVDTSIYGANSVEDKDAKLPVLLKDDTLSSSVVSIDTSDTLFDSSVEEPVIDQGVLQQVPVLEDVLKSLQIEKTIDVVLKDETILKFDNYMKSNEEELMSLEEKNVELPSNMLVHDNVDCNENALVDVAKGEGKDDVPKEDSKVSADRAEETPMVANVNDVLHSQPTHLEPNTKDDMKTDGMESQPNEIEVEK